MIIKELIALLGFKVDDKGLKDFEKKMSGLKKSIAAVGTALAIGAAVKEFSSAVKETVEYLDELDETAQKLGVSTQFLEKMRYSGETAGIGIEGLNTGIKILSKNFMMAKEGSKEAQKAFASAGIKDLKKYKDAEEVVLAISQSMSGMTDKMKRTALAQKIFGKSGTDLIPLLSNYQELKASFAEREDMGLASPENMKAASDLEVAFNKLGTKLKLLKMEFIIKSFPFLQKLSEDTFKWASDPKTKKSLQDVLRVVEAIFMVSKALTGIFRFLNAIIEKIADALLFLVGGSDNKFVQYIGGVASGMFTGEKTDTNQLSLKSMFAFIKQAEDSKLVKSNKSMKEVNAERFKRILENGVPDTVNGMSNLDYLKSSPSSAPIIGGVNKNNNIQMKQENKIEINTSGALDANEVANLVTSGLDEQTKKMIDDVGRNINVNPY